MATESQKREIKDNVGRLVAERFGGDFQKAFEHYDTTAKDGHIDAVELTQLLKDAGIGNWLTRDAWVEGIISALDANDDGAISAAEFDAILKKG